ncbi:MAG TPA: phosphatase PAP2 family protein [Pseudolabrys sp.]|nr:phosphatase PAP2 family protein [Pseudolabrys sp.]
MTGPIRRWIVSLAAVAVASAVAFVWVDRPVALLFHYAVARPEPFAKLTAVPDVLVPLAAAIFVVLGLMNLSGRALSRPQTCALLCSLSLIVAEITKAQLKLVFGRTWPDTWTNNNPSFLRDGVYGFNFFHGGHGYASFPSGHTAVTCAVISVLWVYYPKWRALYVLAVLTVATGLIGANYHFVSDVIAGGFVGVSSGWMLTSLWTAHEHFHKR